MVKSMSMRNNNKTSKKKQKNKKNRLFGKKKDELNSNSIASRENSTVSYTELDDNDNVTPPEPSIATSQLEDTKATDAAPPDLTTENKDSASSGVEEVVTDKAEPTLAHEYQQEVPVETTAILDDSSHSQTRSLSINISSGHMDIGTCFEVWSTFNFLEVIVAIGLRIRINEFIFFMQIFFS